MSLKTKLSALSLTLLFSSVASCIPVSINSNSENQSYLKLNSQGNEKPYIIDLGYKGGVSIGGRIKIGETDSYKTMSAANLNRSGHQFVKSDVDRVRVFLTSTTGSGDLSATLVPIPKMPATGYIQLNKDGSGLIIVLFTNVPGNATYKIAACALTTKTAALGVNPNGTPKFTAPRDITKPTGDFGTITLNGFTNTYILSDKGGDNGIGPGSNTGFVTIGPDLTFSHPNPDSLDVDITLIDPEGATIDSTVNVSDGSAVLPAITIQ